MNVDGRPVGASLKWLMTEVGIGENSDTVVGVVVGEKSDTVVGVCVGDGFAGRLSQLDEGAVVTDIWLASPFSLPPF